MKTTKIENVAGIYKASITTFHPVVNKKVTYKNSSCKDYIQDQFYYWANQTSKSMEGFTWDKVRLLIEIPNKYSANFEEIAENSIDLVNQVGNKIGIEQKTIIYKVDGEPSKFMVIGSNEWLRGSPMLSLFMTLIRVGTSHKKNIDFQETFDKIIKKEVLTDYQTDAVYINRAKFWIDIFVDIGYKKFFHEDIVKNWTSNAHGGSSHSSGINGLWNAAHLDKYLCHVIDKNQVRSELLLEIEQFYNKKMFYVYGRDNSHLTGAGELVE